MILNKKSIVLVVLASFICMASNIYTLKGNTSKHFIEVDQSNFKKEILDCLVPVFLVVLSRFNDTSRLLETLFLEIHKELHENGKVVIMNLEKNLDFAKELGVVTSPVLLVYNKGKKLGTLELNMSPAEIKYIAKYFLELNFFTSLRHYRLLMKLLEKTA